MIMKKRCECCHEYVLDCTCLDYLKKDKNILSPEDLEEINYPIKLVWERDYKGRGTWEQSQWISGIGRVFIQGTVAFIQELEGGPKTEIHNIQGKSIREVKKDYYEIVNAIERHRETEDQQMEREYAEKFNWEPIFDIGGILRLFNDSDECIFSSYYMKTQSGYNTFYKMADGIPQRCGNGSYNGSLEATDACERCYSEYLEQYNNAKKDMTARKKRDAVTISVIIKEMAFKDPENEIFHTIYELLTPEQKETVFKMGID